MAIEVIHIAVFQDSQERGNEFVIIVPTQEVFRRGFFDVSGMTLKEFNATIVISHQHIVQVFEYSHGLFG